MKQFFFLVSLILSVDLAAQKDKCHPTYDPETGREYYDGTMLYTELSPQNEMAFDSLSNTKIISKKYGPEQLVHFAFIIEINGGPSFYKLITPAGDKEIEKEIVHILTRMPLFTPGKCNGKLVPTYTDVELHPFKK
jgi:hypothetical protein